MAPIGFFSTRGPADSVAAMEIGPPDLHQTRMAPAAEPPFHDELEAVWGGVGRLGRGRAAAARARAPPGRRVRAQSRADAWDEEAQALVDPDGRWYWTDRTPPDLDQMPRAARRPRSRRCATRASRSSSPSRWAAGYVEGDLRRATRSSRCPAARSSAAWPCACAAGRRPDVTRMVAAEGLPILSTITGTGTLEGGSFVKLRPGSPRSGPRSAATPRARRPAAGDARAASAGSCWSCRCRATRSTSTCTWRWSTSTARSSTCRACRTGSSRSSGSAGSRPSTPSPARPGRSTRCACGRGGC